MWKLLDVKEIEIWYSSKLTLFFSILYLMQVNGSITNEDEDEEKMKVRKKLVHFLMWNFHVHWLILHSYYILYFISAKPEFPKDSSKYIWDCKILGKSDPRKQRSYWSVFTHVFAIMNSLTPSAKPDITRINLVISITINFLFCSTVPILSALYLQSLAEGQVNLPCSPKNTLHVGKYF